MTLSFCALLLLASGLGRELARMRMLGSTSGWRLQLDVARELVAEAPESQRRAMCRMIRVGMWGDAQVGGAAVAEIRRQIAVDADEYAPSGASVEQADAVLASTGGAR